MSMRRWVSLGLVLALTGCHAPLARLAATPLAAAMATPSSGAAPAPVLPADRVDERFALARLASGVDPASWLARPALAGFQATGQVTLRGHALVRLALPAGLTYDQAATRLASEPGLAGLHPDVQVRRHAFTFTHQDPRYAEQWAHRADRANAIGAWAVVPAAAQGKIIAAYIDTGLDVSHPEFAGRVVGARSFDDAKSGSADVTDNDGHGTHVAGIIGAAGDNGQGVAGLAWGVKLMPLQDGRSLFSVVDAMEYAIHYRPSPDDGSRVRVINMSLGFSSGGVSYLFADALADAHDAGVTVTVSAGNDGAGVVEYPAATPGALAVGATAQALFWEHLASFSNFGDRLDLVAPGEHILSTLPTGRKDDAGKDLPAYGFESGTSMAAPYVAGVVALLAARYDPNNQHLDANFADQVRQRLVDSADDLGTPGWDPLFGAGRVNAGRAVAPATLDAAP